MSLRTVLFALVLGVSVACLQAQENGVPSGPASPDRLRVAAELAQNYFRTNGAKQDDAAITKALLGEFLKKSGLSGEKPKRAPMTLEECTALAEKNLLAVMDQRYPILDEKGLQAAAEEKYPLHKVGDKVTVHYMYRGAPVTVTGTYYHTHGSIVKVGKAQIALADMEGIENNEEEILMFSPDTTAQLRKEYMEKLDLSTLDSREKFKKNNQATFLREALEEAGKTNEALGYVCMDGEWELPVDALGDVIVLERDAYLTQVARDKADTLQRQVAAIGAQYGGLETELKLLPVDHRLNPSQALAARKAADEKAAAEAKRLEEEEQQRRAELANSERNRQEEARRLREAELERVQKRGQDELEAVELESKTLQYVIIGIVVVFVLIVIGIMVGLKLKKKHDEEIYKKFFVSEGKLQKEFWDAAEADPEHFKYVAYMFPDERAGTEALSKLSYMHVTEKGTLHCSKNLMYGVYPHQGKAVAFVGGVDYHYAPWREATAVLPELPGAEYFKVSPEPEVLLEIPVLDEQEAADLHIESIGIEEMEDSQGGGFIRCYKYRADTKEHALDFLQKFEVNEEGIVVQVETAQGVFGKDENGIFTA